MDNNGNTRCTGENDTSYIWVEPTPKVVLVPQSDTLCDGEATDIEITSVSRPTHPIKFRYHYNPEYPDSVNVTINGDTTGLDRGYRIQDNIDNLSDTAQLVRFVVTPYTIDNNNNEHCTGESDTSYIWVEPTPKVVLVPQSDTLCDGEATDIEITSVSRPTHPIKFRYHYNPEYPDSVNVTINGDTTGLDRGYRIQDNIDNLSDTAQLVRFVVTPYTIDNNNNEHCTGESDTSYIWVEPTPKVVLVPQSDTLCDGEATDIEITSVSRPTHPIKFRYHYNPEYPDSVNVTINGDTTGLDRGYRIQDNIDNLSDTAQLVRFVVTPYTIDNNNNEHCTGESDTSYIWVEPTPKVVLVPQSDTLCDGEATDIEITSVSRPTHPIKFRYHYTPEYPDSVNVTINGDTTGLDRGYRIQDNIDNLSDTAQLVRFVVTPYTIDNNNNEHCTGESDTSYIWVEPTPKVVLVPQSDTLCDGEATDIEITSVSRPTHPIKFRYHYTPEYPDSVSVTINGDTTGLDRGYRIQDNIDNLSDTAQLVRFVVTPYTIDNNNNEHCTGESDTSYIWVEPTPKVVLVPQSDTLCDGEATDIEITSVSRPTHPIKFRYHYTPEYPDSVSVTINGDTTGLDRGYRIQDNIDNLSDTAQLVRFVVTPYTIDNNDNEHCTGESDTSYIWVEPTPKVIANPQADTICNDTRVSIELTSPSRPTREVRFRYLVELPGGVTANPGTQTGMRPGDFITDILHNATDTDKLVKFIIIPLYKGSRIGK